MHFVFKICMHRINFINAGDAASCAAALFIHHGFWNVFIETLTWFSSLSSYYRLNCQYYRRKSELKNSRSTNQHQRGFEATQRARMHVSVKVEMSVDDSHTTVIGFCMIVGTFSTCVTFRWFPKFNLDVSKEVCDHHFLQKTLRNKKVQHT